MLISFFCYTNPLGVVVVVGDVKMTFPRPAALTVNDPVTSEFTVVTTRIYIVPVLRLVEKDKLGLSEVSNADVIRLVDGLLESNTLL